MKKKKPIICIMDLEKDRCLREEKALENVVRDRGLNVIATASYGEGHITRSGCEGPYPTIEVEGLFFHGPNPGEELTEAMLHNFMDMLIRKGLIEPGPGGA